MDNLFRVVAARDWEKALVTGRVPRCASDERAGHVHLSERSAVETIANAYFEPGEAPLALEIDRGAIEAELEYSEPSEAKPWRQAHLNRPNVLTDQVLRTHPLIVANRDGRDRFVLG
ncbi:MAG: DUF952 domain-containing protein [Pseudomonadota bacterium]|nr:DUF952 domain-containing protein [Pseudomonadota bacterium]